MKATATIDAKQLAKRYSPQVVAEASRQPQRWMTDQSGSEDDERVHAASHILHDFGRFSVADPSRATCPLSATPRRCPFGGACHSCPAKVQTKLAVADPDDSYEREADRAAGQVMQIPGTLLGHPAELRQWEGKPANPPVNALTDGGQPLSSSERAFFEPRFGHDFSDVRVHTGTEAAVLNEGLTSRAFTYGQHIWLGQNTGSAYRRLLAHELAHTIQQRGSHAPSIQRSVQESGVRSPADVLRKIRNVLAAHKWALIPHKLYHLGNAFHPGKGVDLPSNAFVYTCKGGWIDMGHFFFTAAGATLAHNITWRKSIETEREQQRERTKIEKMSKAERDKYIGRSWEEARAETKAGRPEKESRRGVAWSAWTIEDVPSDLFGIYFGKSLRDDSDIAKEMEKFFSRQHAVDASRDKTRLKKMMTETLGSDDPEKLPRQHKKYPFYPVRLQSARELCGEG